MTPAQIKKIAQAVFVIDIAIVVVGLFLLISGAASTIGIILALVGLLSFGVDVVVLRWLYRRETGPPGSTDRQ